MLIKLFREEITPLLPRNAFLRRDRGLALSLYVTNAPLLQADIYDLMGSLCDAGYSLTWDGSLLHIIPTPRKLEALEASLTPPESGLAADLYRFAGLPMGELDIWLFIQGVQRLESGEGIAAWEKMLRQKAARALRGENGGGLYLCALLRDEHAAATQLQQRSH